MTKKIIVLIIAIVLCLSVVGGCFALYAKDASNLVIGFGSEDAVRLTLATQNATTFNFGGVALNPTNDSASQAIVLDVNGQASDMAGLYGELKVTLDTTISEDYYTLSAVAKGAGDDASSTSYTQAQLTSGVTLPLDDLPQYVTLTIALTEAGKNDTAFASSVSNKTISVSVSWKVVEWTAVDGGYYIVGTESGWAVNKNAVLLSDSVSGTTDLAKINSVTLTAGQSYKVVQYHAGAELTWFDVEWQNGSAVVSSQYPVVVIDTEHGNNITVTTTGTYMVCVNTTGDNHYVWVQPK